MASVCSPHDRKAYIQFGVFVITLFCLPETLYSRQAQSTAEPIRRRSYLDLLLFRKRLPANRRVEARDFLRPFAMMRYVCVVIPALYYMTAFTYGSVIFAVTGSVVFHQVYGFNTAQTGLMLSIPLLIGCLIGEANAGWFTDWLVYQSAKRRNGKRTPEPRLDALWLALLCPIGTIIQGVCITHSRTTSWVGNAFGMGLSSLGLQVATTVVFSYTTDVSRFISLSGHPEAGTDHLALSERLWLPLTTPVTSVTSPRAQRSRAF